MRKRLVFALGFVLVATALASAPVQGGNCVLDTCGPRKLACQRSCGHVITCTEQCDVAYTDCKCQVCGIC
jgi:hypothetical protein